MLFTQKSKLVAGAVSTMVILCSAASYAETLSLQKCEQLALEQSLEASTLKNKLETEQLKNFSSKAALKPTVSLTSLGSSISGQDNGETQVSPLSVGLNIKQPIGQMLPVDGLLANTTALGVQTSELSWQIAQIDSQKSALDLKYQVRNAYVNYLKAKATLDLNKEQLKQIESYLLPEVNAKLKVGVATKVDVMKVESQLRNAKLTVSKAEHSFDQAKDALLLLIGIDSDGFDLEQLGSIAEIEQMTVSMADVEKAALDNRTEIKKAELLVDQAKLNAKKTQISSSMALTLGTTYSKTWADQGLGLTTGASISSRDMTINGNVNLAKPQAMASSGSNWKISLDLSSPILDWGQAAAQREQAQNDIDSAQIALEQTKNSVKSDMVSAFYGFTEAQERLAVAKLNLQASDSSASITKARYDAGVASSSELLDAELALFESKSSVTQSEYDLFSAKDKLVKAMGGERSEAK